jgi:hypothetical protein
VGAGAYFLLQLGNRPAPPVEETADGAKPPTDKVPDPVRPSEPGAFVSEPFNFRYATPPAPWIQDNVTRPAGKLVTVALRRSKPTAYVAVVARDHSKGRVPRDAEIVDDTVRRLQLFFNDTLDYEQLPDGKLAGQRAQRLRFRGLDAKNELVRGECRLLLHKGIVYWLMTWAPAEVIDSAQTEFDDLRQRFTLMNKRDDWADKTPKAVLLEGKKADYTLQDLDDIWKQQTSGEDFDAAADMALTANDLLEIKDAVRYAKVLVLLLKPQSDRKPEDVARAYYERQQKDKVEVKVLSDVAMPVGNVPGRITRMHVRKPQGERFVLLAVVPQGDQILAIQGECDWKRRSLWERDFSRLVSTYRGKK